MKLQITERKVNKNGVNTHFRLSNGSIKTITSVIKMVEQGILEGYQIVDRKDKKYLRDIPNKKIEDNLDYLPLVGFTYPLEVPGGIEVQGKKIIDSDGHWVGDETNLIGPQGSNVIPHHKLNQTGGGNLTIVVEGNLITDEHEFGGMVERALSTYRWNINR